MLNEVLEKFGTRVRIEETASATSRTAPVTIDIQRDRRGEYFLLKHAPGRVPDLTVLNVQPGERHLLLMSRVGAEKQKFLCGHDERHWFVAAIPESAPVSNVAQARSALKPVAVRERELRAGVPGKLRDRRRNRAFIRQGEWFFVPDPEARIPELLVLHREPLVRSRMGKPHFAEDCARTGGNLLYVSRLAPGGLNEAAYKRRLRNDPDARRVMWTPMRSNPDVHVRGRITHPDHKTVILSGWHRVYMNTETQARANASVVFLD